MGELQNKKTLPITQWLSSKEWAAVITKMVPKDGISAQRFIGSAITLFAMKRELQRCTQESCFTVLKECASLGIDVSPTMKRAYIIPYGNAATLQLSYTGMIELAMRNGSIKTIEAHEVRDGDIFDTEFGSTGHLRHIPNYKDAGEVYAYYCYIKLNNGGEVWQVISKSEVEQIRDLCAAKSSGAWKNFFDEMAKKVIIKRTLKTIPCNDERLNRAIAIDDEVNSVIDITDEAQKSEVKKVKQDTQKAKAQEAQAQKVEQRQESQEAKQEQEVQDVYEPSEEELTEMDRVREEYAQKERQAADDAMEIVT